jgi:hypothetical protein
MSPHEAASMLGVPHTADADTVDAAIARLRVDYAGQIARAVTPEMATYWRNRLARLDEARDVIRQAAEARARADAEPDPDDGDGPANATEVPPQPDAAHGRWQAPDGLSLPGGTSPRDERTGLPWEADEGPAMERATATVKRVLFEPRRAFSEMRRTGGLAPPLWFSLLVGVPSAAFGGYAYFLLQVALNPSEFNNMTPREAALAGLFVMPLYVAVVYPLSLVLNAGLQHLALLLLEKTPQPFETTFRTTAYAVGAASVLQVIPILGLLLSGAAQIVVNIIGLSRTHDIPAGRAAMAYFLPVITCCACFVVIIMAGTWIGSAFGR